jgi:ribosome maturation factor RimP
MLDLPRQMRTVFEPTLEGLGFDLVAVEWLADTRSPILRVSIDAEGGISAEDCALVSRHLSQILDERDPISTRYRLEVSSPGIERPVQRLSDFRRFGGFRAKIRLMEGEPRRRMTGVLRGVVGEVVRVEVDGKVLEFPVDRVERAHLVLELEEYQRLADGIPADPGPVGGGT